jgi:dTDP-4-amino-4,6-dideoxygalactose transaminase
VNELIKLHGSKIAVIIPYATFGNCLDLDFYNDLSIREGIPVVVDAAASLGSLNSSGTGFGTGSAAPVVFSMHATKTFAVAEAGLVYSENPDLIRLLRAMSNFGFGTHRTATMPGLNGKLPEVLALMALKKLDELDTVIEDRELLTSRYRKMLPDFQTQQLTGNRTTNQFTSLLLPESHAGKRAQLLALLAEKGIGSATYFSPHLIEQPYFKERCLAGPLDNTDKVARRIVSLPMSDKMTLAEVDQICECVCASLVEASNAY